MPPRAIQKQPPPPQKKRIKCGNQDVDKQGQTTAQESRCGEILEDHK